MKAANFKIVILSILVMVVGLSCKSTDRGQLSTDEESVNKIENDTVSIANEDVGYEIIIIEPGFNAFLKGTARQEGYYDQSLLESRNSLFVRQWNIRVTQPNNYDPNLYEMPINYDPHIDYGYEVNYKLYNYFIFFQLKYKQQLTELVPRI
ncbi:DUF6146 family protein [Winogradskyella aurantiaca]|uniref:DUF6146 family protein n=1 Tax=Winogradskyella aurantiaca TaxID=2219558 RepID=UPI000E1C7970|nr:DUF6146 family protein [Winogradskyella aurantiaca]